MQYISQSQLRQIIEETKGATFAQVICVTDPKLKKTNNPFYVDGKCVVVKENVLNVTINFIYANSVNNQRAREGKETTFTPHPRKWGVRVPNSSLVEHNGTTYLECRVNNVKSTQYIDTRTGNVVPFEDIQEFLPSKSSSSTQGTSKEIIVRDFKLSSIKQINLNKEQYKVADY